MSRPRCHLCTYSAASATSLEAHVSMAHPGALPNQTTVHPDGRPTSEPALTFAQRMKAAREAKRLRLEQPEPPESVATGDTVPGTAYATREAWMLAAVDAMRPYVAERLSVECGPVRISFGWPGGRGSKKGVRGQCWMPQAVKDQVPAIFVSPAMEREDPVTILGIILHEMNHAIGNIGHTGPFAKAAKALGYVKPWTSSEGKTDELKAYLTSLAERLGPLDHGAIDPGHGLVGIGPAAPPVQSTRMLKVHCPEDGYTLRATRKWLEVAIPECPICGALMDVERKGL